MPAVLIRYIYILFILTTCLSLAMLIKQLGVIFNVSTSMRQGFYIGATGPIRAGDVVSFCLNKSSQTFGLNRGYLMPGDVCHGSAPLVKEVIAVPGDNVRLTMHSIQVNGKVYNELTHLRDSAARKLFIYPRGTYVNTTGYWMLGNNSPKSWDSRYWGPISRSQIISKLKPLWTW